MLTLDEVKAGLLEGKSYKRKFGAPDYEGCEYVKALAFGRFEHTVVGMDSGGVAELDVSIMSPDRWPTDNWELDD